MPAHGSDAARNRPDMKVVHVAHATGTSASMNSAVISKTSLRARTCFLVSPDGEKAPGH